MTQNEIYFLSPSHQRSLMAEGWAQKTDFSGWKFDSGGWVDAKTNLLSIEAMKELCIDISEKAKKRANPDKLSKASVIIAIHDFDEDQEFEIPYQCQNKVVHWNLPNPEKRAKTPIEEWVIYQEICDSLAIKVKHLEEDVLNVFT
jgi:arsenate reductase (thioredoxin)